MGHSLHGATDGLQWVVDGYTVPFAALLISAGSVSDRAGARRVFGWGLASRGLRALTRKACQNLAQQVLGEGLAPAIQDWLVERADGNPFYLEELIRAVASGARSAARDRGGHGAGAPRHAGRRRQARDARRQHLRMALRRDGVSALISDRDRRRSSRR